MSRRPLLATVASLALSFLGLLVAIPAAARPGYLVHVEIADVDDNRSVKLALPWSFEKGGSPFDFTEHDDDDLSVERLRWVWTTLRRSPEGEVVRITRRDKTTLASREDGRLVIRSERRRGRDSGRVLIPGAIVDAVLARDGRLENRDLERLLERRPRLDLVTVEGDDGLVRVWIGRNSSAD